MVQQELHPSDEGREGHGDPGEPLANEAAAGVPEALTDAAAEPGISTPPRREPELEFETPFELKAQSEADFEREHERQLELTQELRDDRAADTVPPADLRLGIDDRAAVFMHRLGVWKDEVVAWFKTLASAAVYATLIVTFGFQVARVEGQSMAPTLADQDRLIVNKLAYRMGEPRRGDIVMLYYPLNPDKSFVKRVIAEEGDQVRIVDGRVYVNDVPMGDDFVPPEYRSHDDFGPTTIPEGYYFVMGDHRNNSSDSRHWGNVPKKYVIGKVQLRWWPIPNARIF